MSTKQLYLLEPDKTAECQTRFEVISECIYSSKSLGRSGQSEYMTCDCFENWDSDLRQNTACGEDSDCINRVTSVECVNGHCLCGKNCQNQRFQRKQYAQVSVFQTEKKGYGLRANTNLPESAFVYEYIGEVVAEEAFRRRMVYYDEQKFKHFYFMMLTKDAFIDATVKGSLARFVNHSCNPNAYVDKWVVGDRLRMGIFTKRPIEAGEEITFDYNVDRYGAQSQPCYCGEPNCLGFMGGKTQTDAALLLPDGISEALGVTQKQERQWLKENKHLRQKNDSINEAFVASLEVSPLEQPDVSRVMGALMKSQDLSVVQKLVDRILLTNDEKVNASIVRFHGYKTLSKLLTDFHDDHLVVCTLEILTKWPKLTRNKIESSRIEDVVRDISETTANSSVRRLASNLLEEWGSLQMAYRIPKNASEKLKSNSPSAYTRNTPDEEEDLPEGWEQAVDPNTGSKYYYHRQLGISKWERPMAAVPKGPKGPRSTPKPNRDNELTKQEEARLQREREEHFMELREKERSLQDFIAQSQREAEEKQRELERLKSERKEAKKKKALTKSALQKPPASLDAQWRKLFAKYVPNLIKKHEKEIGRDNVKGCAKELVNILASKEVKRNAQPPADLDNHKIKKVKEYCSGFMEKFLVKYRAKKGNGEPEQKRIKTE